MLVVEVSELVVETCIWEIYLAVEVKAAGTSNWLQWLLVFDTTEKCLCLLGLTVPFDFLFQKPSLAFKNCKNYSGYKMQTLTETSSKYYIILCQNRRMSGNY